MRIADPEADELFRQLATEQARLEMLWDALAEEFAPPTHIPYYIRRKDSDA